MKTPEVMRWIDLRQNEAEESVGMWGKRAHYRGVRMEVRIEYTVADGLHVSWKVCDSHHNLEIIGRIPFPSTLSEEVLERVFGEGMKRAMKFAELWLELLES